MQTWSEETYESLRKDTGTRNGETGEKKNLNDVQETDRSRRNHFDLSYHSSGESRRFQKLMN